MKNRNLLFRTLTCVIGVPAVFALIFLLPEKKWLAFCILVVIASGAGAWEMSRMLYGKGDVFSLSTAALPAVTYLEGMLHLKFCLTEICAVFMLILMLAWQIRDGEHDNFKSANERIAKTCLIIFYPAYFASFCVRIAAIDGITSCAITLFFGMVFFNDMFAYVFGMLFGRGNAGLFKVSPKKSVAGFIGGALTCVAVCLAFFRFFPGQLPSIPVFEQVLLALLISFCGNVGDLAESVFKRSAGVKDSGKIIPGRGGILDSIDSVIASAPVFWLVFFTAL